MRCPFCQTENREDREECYHCKRDISMLRLIANMAKHHYNQGLEFAERDRSDEAIHEMKNALELDASLINAHVVLGTLYARKQMFEEARAAWRRAIEQDHRFAKAHEYLDKADQVEGVLPSMQKLQRINSLLLGTIGVVLLLAIVMTVVALTRGGEPAPAPAADLGRLEQLLAQARTQPGEAYAGLRRLESDATAPADQQRLAGEFRANIETQWEQRLDSARRALQADHAQFALELLDALEAQQPAQSIRDQAADLKFAAYDRMLQRVQAAAQRTLEGDYPYEQFIAEAQAVLDRLAQSRQREELEALVAQVRERQRERVLAQIEIVLAQAPLAEALVRIADAEAQFPEAVEELEAKVDERLARESAAMEAEIENLAAQGLTEQARERIGHLAQFYRDAQREDPVDRLERLNALVQESERAQRLTAARAAFDEERWHDFLQASAELETLSNDEAVQTELREMRTTAGRRYARAMWEWMHERDPQYEDLRISAEDAARTVREYALTLEFLPGDLNYARGPITFYAGASFLKLGEPERAYPLLQEVANEHSRLWVGNAARQMLREHAEEFAPFIAEPAEASLPATDTATQTPAIMPANADGPTT